MSKQRAYLFCAALVFIVSVVVFGNLPGRWLFVGELQNSAHVPAFALVAALLLGILRDVPSTRHRSASFRYVTVTLIATSLGAAIEIAQGALHRDMSLTDVFHDFLGATLGLGLVHGFNLEPAPRTLRNASVFAAIGATLIAAFPVSWSAAAYIHRNAQFPVLVQFGSLLDRYFLFDCGALHRSHVQDSQLLVELNSTCRRQIGIAEPYPDWTGYSHLNIDFANATDKDVRLTIRIEDTHHNQEYSDRFNRGLTLEANARKTFVIPLEEVRRAPASRTMDMRQIYWVNIFANESAAGSRVALHRIWLD